MAGRFFRRLVGASVVTGITIPIVLRVYNPATGYIQSTTARPSPPPAAAAAVAVASAPNSAATTTTTAASTPASLSTQPSKLVTLSDGRRISFHQFGHPNGRVVFVIHSAGNSRFEIESLGLDSTTAGGASARDAYSLGIRVIAIDRSGYGLSDDQPNRTIFDTASDISTVASALGITEYSIAGLSTGASFALAAAKVLPPERLRAVAIISGDAPHAVRANVLAYYSHATEYPSRSPRKMSAGGPPQSVNWKWLSELKLLTARLTLYQFPSTLVSGVKYILKSSNCQSDIDTVNRLTTPAAAAASAGAAPDDGAAMDLYFKGAREGQRNGVAGYYRDLWLIHSKASNPYGAATAAAAADDSPPPALGSDSAASCPGATCFRLADIRASLPVYIVHGDADVMVPPSYARYYEHQLSLRGRGSRRQQQSTDAATEAVDGRSTTKCVIRPGLGHFSAITDTWTDVLTHLTRHHTKPPPSSGAAQ